MKLWGSISGVTFILLMGLAGGLENSTLTFTQFIVWATIGLSVLGFSLNMCTKLSKGGR